MCCPGQHLRQVIGIARGRHTFTGLAAALLPLLGWAEAADPRIGVRQRLDVRAAATFAEPPHHMFMLPAEEAPLQMVGPFRMDAVAMDLVATYPWGLRERPECSALWVDKGPRA